MAVIGISGKARHGKNTLGLFLAMHLRVLGLTPRPVAFADRLKKDAVLFGWNGDKDAVGRFALQRYGETMRARDPMHWINALGRSLGTTPQELFGGKEVFIITDVRYKNEAEWVRKNGGMLIRIEATKNGEPIPSGDHISETDLDKWKDWDWMITAELGDLMTIWERAARIAERVAYRL